VDNISCPQVIQKLYISDPGEGDCYHYYLHVPAQIQKKPTLDP